MKLRAQAGKFCTCVHAVQPVAFGSVDGLSSRSFPSSGTKCFTPEVYTTQAREFNGHASVLEVLSLLAAR